MHRPSLRTIRQIAYALIFVLAGLYASWWWRTDPAQAPVAGAPRPPAIAPATKLPEFTLADLAGSPRSITEFAGRPLLINFWATWCAPCLREMPMFESVWQANKAGDGLQIIGIAVDRPEDVGPYLEKTGVTYPILVGRSDAMEAAGSFGPAFAGLPFTVFVAPDRQILHMHAGELSRERLDEILADAGGVASDHVPAATAQERPNR